MTIFLAGRHDCRGADLVGWVLASQPDIAEVNCEMPTCGTDHRNMPTSQTHVARPRSEKRNADNVTPNFRRRHRLGNRDGPSAVSCNRHFPRRRLCRCDRVDTSNVKPIDVSEFAGALSENGLEIAVANQLLRTIEESDLAELTKSRAKSGQVLEAESNRRLDLQLVGLISLPPEGVIRVPRPTA